jgi:RHS repeat-associated protein
MIMLKKTNLHALRYLVSRHSVAFAITIFLVSLIGMLPFVHKDILQIAHRMISPRAYAAAPVIALGFNEGSGTTTADASGNGNTGTLVGGVTWTTAGKYGKALSFDGSSGVVRIPDSPSWKVDGLTGYTVSMWVKVKNVTGNYLAPLGKGEWSSDDIVIYKFGNQWQFGIRTTDLICGGITTAIPYLSTLDNTYHHIALSMDSSAGQCKFYSDGGVVGTDQFVSGTTVFATGTGLNNLFIGGLDGGHYLNSDIDEVRVYTSALTQAEIQTDMNTPIGGGSGDTTPPVITNVTAGSITTTGATITWTTNENSDSQVEYGTSTAYGQTTTLSTALITAHSQGLSGLNPATVYHYRVRSKDGAGNLAVSGDFSFTTGSGDTNPPVITNVTAGSITTTGATITWTTNENSDSQVEYGTSTAYGQTTTLSTALITAHSQGLSGLSPATVYHYRVRSKDGAGNLAVSGDFSFTTPVVANNVPLTKLKEYVYAGGRLLASEEKSCLPTLDQTSVSFSYTGGTGSINVIIPSECSWTAQSNAGWITVTGGLGGNGNGTVSYSVAVNSGAQRSSTITISGQDFTINQGPSPSSCIYRLNKSNDPVPELEGSYAFTLETDAGCPWTASSNAGWLSITSATIGTGPASFSYKVLANSGGQRIGLITVAGQQLTITQAPNPASCTFTLNPSNQSFGVGGGSGSFDVMPGAGCHWDAATSNGWITITGGAQGTGNTVSFIVQSNNGASRTGSISVRGQIFTIFQCGLEISPTSASFTNAGGTGGFSIETTASCAWHVESTPGWIFIIAGNSGNGNGIVDFNVDLFPDHTPPLLQRTGSIIVANGNGTKSFTVIQSHDCCSSGFNTLSAVTESRGLWARYFGNPTLSGQPDLERIDPVVDFNWADNRPDAALHVDGFSARWDGQLAAPSNEDYTFYLYSEGGARLWVNNRLVIDRWTSPFEPYTRSEAVELKASEKADIRVEYYKAGGEAAIHLLWSSATTPRQTIPQRYLYPEAATKKSTPAETNKQTGMLLPPGSDSDPKIMQPNIQGKWPVISLGRAIIVLWIASALFILLLRFEWVIVAVRLSLLHIYKIRRTLWSAVTMDVAVKYAVCFRMMSQTMARVAQTGQFAGSSKRLIIGASQAKQFALLLSEHLRISMRDLRSVQLKLILHRALIIALILRLAMPLTPTEAESLIRAAHKIWPAAREYAGVPAIRSINISPVKPRGNPFSIAAQTNQVTELKVCPRQLIMFVDERYTLTPIALDSSQQVVHGAAMSWSSLATNIADVSSFGEVEAKAVGNTTIVIQSGAATLDIPIEVQSGMRPTGSNQEADLDATTDCAAEQSLAFAPLSASAFPQAQLLDDNGVMLDWDPAPLPNSLATYFKNAVGSPRFSAMNRGGAALPTSTQLGSDNYQFDVPVATVGGRGASANIGMTFNSRVWNLDNGKLTFNYVGAFPAPGWSMGYGKIIRNYNNTGTGDRSGVGSGNSPGDYLLLAGDGTRIRLAARYESAIGRWLNESDDGSFLRFDPRSGEVRSPDGGRMIYSNINGALLPSAIINNNGGAITMTYRDYCEGTCVQVFRHRTALSAVRDTLGRYVTFHYYGDIDYPANAANGQPAGELAAIKIPNMNGAQQEVIKVEYQPITLKYNFGGLAVDAPASNTPIQVVRRIYYPQTGRGFLFLDYSSYGMPRKISKRMGMTGSGGVITNGTEMAYTTYNYTTIDPSDPYGRNQIGSLNDSPQFTLREEWWLGKTDANGTPTTAPTQYEYNRTTNSSTEAVTIKDLGRNSKEVTTIGTDSSAVSFGKVVSIEQKKIDSETVLSKQSYFYMTGPAGEAEIEKVETIDETEQGRLVSFGYGPYGRLSDRYEYGFKQGGNYQVRRRTHYDYVDAQTYLDARFLRLITRVSIYEGNDALKAKTEYVFDDYAAMGGMQSYELGPTLYPPNHDDEYDQSKVLRGNITAVRTFSKISPAESTTRRVRYDIFGNMVEAELSCCEVKTFSFSSATAYAQPDSIRSGEEAGLSLVTTYQYNYFTGLLENGTNPDGLLTVYGYDDAFRLKQVTDTATGVVSLTEFERDGNGNDLLSYISRTSYDDGGETVVVTGKQWLDGSMRVTRAGTGTGAAPDSYDMAATVYDGWGRVAKQSNPYSGDTDGLGSAGYWTVNTYDELSRVIRVTLPDNQFPDNQFIQTNYNGAAAIVTDTVGRKRRSEVDGLGRLVKVTEQNPANGNLEWETNYSYDVLNNLTQSNQGGQLRTFTYDAKGRLTSEIIPEAGTTTTPGTTTYTYTDFDAVASRTDARGVVTTYTYGQLNLLTGVSYNTSSAPGVATTAAVSITPKTSSPGKGQIASVTDGVGSESYEYDSSGRLQSRTRVIDEVNYQTRYEHNAIGQKTLMIYPSGKRVKMAHDERGRLSALQRVDTAGGVQENYLSGINYRVDGQISGLNLGNGTTESFGYSDDRLQRTSQTVVRGGATLLSLSYGYGASAGQMGSGTTAGNSGQIISVSGTINGQNRNQTFNYDNVGRLAAATGWGVWARRYDYDRFGNRTAVWDAVSGGNQRQNAVIAELGGIKRNRLASLDGATINYDASGNLTVDEGRTNTYDAENRIVSVSVNGAGTERYSYDANNHRVKKDAGGVVTHYVWEDHVIAEYDRGGGLTGATGTRYYHQDQLSTRIITDGEGSVVGTTDQLPFGEEIGGSGEAEKHKFTTYERDGTGLDYAVNRHYDQRQGRFKQVDPLGMGAASLGEPQSLNLYSYVRNDPVNGTDPTGLYLAAPPDPSPEAAPDFSGFLDFLLRSLFNGGGGGETYDAGDLDSVTVTAQQDEVKPNWTIRFPLSDRHLLTREEATQCNPPVLKTLDSDAQFNIGNNARILFAPDVADAMSAAFRELNRANITPTINSGYRTVEDQQRARNQQRRRGRRGNPVAQGTSLHQAGYAVDINGTEDPDFQNIITTMEAHGFTWGGNFVRPRPDPPHFQIDPFGPRGAEHQRRLEEAADSATNYYNNCIIRQR